METEKTDQWSDADESRFNRLVESDEKDEKRLRAIDKTFWHVLYTSVDESLKTAIDNKIASDPNSKAGPPHCDSLAVYELLTTTVGAMVQSTVDDLHNEWSNCGMKLTETSEVFVSSFKDKVNRIEAAG